MDITIDTTHPLNDRDRAILRALLDAQTPPAAVQVPAAPGAPRPNSAAAIAAGIGAGMPTATGRASGVPASARRPVADQPGVSFTESVAESSPETDTPDS